MVADRVGQVHGGGPGVDRRLEYAAQVVAVAARAVFGRELHVVREGLGVRHGVDGGLNDLVAAHLELVLEVDVGGGDEGVDARPDGLPDRLPGAVDVRPGGAGEGGDLGLLQPARDLGDGLEVAFGSRWKTGLEHVDPQLFELERNSQLFRGVHARPRALLAIPECRVENDDAVGHGGYSFQGVVGESV